MNEEAKSFRWKGIDICNLGDVMNALLSLECEKEARDFMKVYFEFTPHAYQNVGYAAGYFDNDTADRIYQWCQTSHPVFGLSHPSPEAFEAGKRVMEMHDEY